MVDRKKEVNKSTIIDLKISWLMDELGLGNVQRITSKEIKNRNKRENEMMKDKFCCIFSRHMYNMK